MNRGTLLCVSLVVTLLSVPAAADGQRTRRELIDQARGEFSDAAAIQLLLAAQDPALGPPDSLWAVAGFDLAGALLRQQQRAAAAAWLRWVIRHAPTWPMDPIHYPPSVVDAYDNAVRALQGDIDTGDFTVRTEWVWPARFEAGAPGRIEATVEGSAVPATIVVAGRDERGAASGVDLPTGTYELTISAEGYEPARITREALPGVTITLAFELVPLLPGEVESGVAARLLRISYERAGVPVCGSGILAGADGLVLTSYRLVRDAGPLEVSAFGGREVYRNVAIAAADPELDLAVLRLAQLRAEPMAAADAPPARGVAWTVHHRACDDVGSSRTRVASWEAGQAQPFELLSPVPEAARGAPLIDRRGMLLGLVSDPAAAVPIVAAQPLFDAARRPVAEVPPTDLRPARKFPWVWVSAGGAAAGLAVALLGGGGGGNGGTGTPPPPTTGGLIITFPN